MVKTFIILILIALLFGLIYLITTGAFCSCSPVKCPNNNDPLRSVLT